jgi:NAD(P)H-dependent FMN reductase
MNDIYNIKIIIGSTCEGRFADQATTWIANELIKQEHIHVEILDLRDYDMPFFNEPVSPSMKQEPYTNEAVARFTAKIAQGDAFIIVTPEYNHGAPAVLKNAIDWVSPEWNNKPVAFVSYGAVGGARVIEQLRLVAIELQMVPIKNAVYIPGEQYFPVAFGKASAADMFIHMQKSGEAMITQLLWWTKILKTARQ